MDRARADFLSFAFDDAAKQLAAKSEERGIKIAARHWKAKLIEMFAIERHKSVDTVRDMMKPERRVLRKKLTADATSKKPRRSGAR